MESEECQGEVISENQGANREFNIKQEQLKCQSYDDISSDACDGVDEKHAESSKEDSILDRDMGGLKHSSDICGDSVNVRKVESEVDQNCESYEKSEKLGEIVKNLKSEVRMKDERADSDEFAREEESIHVDSQSTAEKETSKNGFQKRSLEKKVSELSCMQSEVCKLKTKMNREDSQTASSFSVKTQFERNMYGPTPTSDRISPPNFSSDSETEISSIKSQNQSLINTVLSADNDLMKFAEILYKCTLCTSIPSILTSKSNFLKHVREQHFSNDNCFKKCEFCSLKFCTEEDLKEHVRHLHKETNGKKGKTSHGKTGSDVSTKSHDGGENENDSDSDSSGHRNYKAKLVKKVKPVLDFENPKQLVDHTGIQAWDGSLDLTKKESSAKTQRKEPPVSAVSDKKSQKQPQEPNLLNVQQITDQIMKSNFQGRSQSTPNGSFPFTPSFTPEFGKYTKLVREGGNIVYFCQVCNWKSPIKATFHGHCGTATHKSKVLQAEDPDSTESPVTTSERSNSAQNSPKPVSNTSESSFHESNYWTSQSQAGVSKVGDSSNYNQFLTPRGVTFNGRSPVIAPFKNSNSSERHTPYRRHTANTVDLSHKNGKQNTPTATSVRSSKSQGGSSDSDSDDSKTNSEQMFPWNKHSLNMSTMYHNYPFFPFFTPPPPGHRFTYDGFHSPRTSTSKMPCREPVIRNEPDKLDSSKAAAETIPDNSAKRRTETASNIEEPPQKKSKEDVEVSANMSAPTGKVEALFKLYKCHACPFEYSDIEEYEKHFEKEHKALEQTDVCVSNFAEKQQAGRMTELVTGDFETGENFRVQKLKDILPDFVVENKTGNVPRDYLLSCIGTFGGVPNVELWSSACNKAMREIYPQSLAQRKGKYKKTYYFGVAMVENFQGQEEPAQVEGDNSQLYSPLRDLNLEMEKLMEQLPGVVTWTGNMENGIYRGEILMVIAENLQNQDIGNWGPQCNRAIRLVYPKVDIKRKGKFKSTMYFGVDFHSNVKKASFMSQSKGMAFGGQFMEGGESFGQSAEGIAQGEEFPMWMKEEAQKHMTWYLQRFGGVTAFDMTESEEAVDDNDNDGDDEGESIESSVNT